MEEPAGQKRDGCNICTGPTRANDGLGLALYYLARPIMDSVSVNYEHLKVSINDQENKPLNTNLPVASPLNLTFKLRSQPPPIPQRRSNGDKIQMNAHRMIPLERPINAFHLFTNCSDLTITLANCLSFLKKLAPTPATKKGHCTIPLSLLTIISPLVLGPNTIIFATAVTPATTSGIQSPLFWIKAARPRGGYVKAARTMSAD